MGHNSLDTSFRVDVHDELRANPNEFAQRGADEIRRLREDNAVLNIQMWRILESHVHLINHLTKERMKVEKLLNNVVAVYGIANHIQSCECSLCKAREHLGTLKPRSTVQPDIST